LETISKRKKRREEEERIKCGSRKYLQKLRRGKRLKQQQKMIRGVRRRRHGRGVNFVIKFNGREDRTESGSANQPRKEKRELRSDFRRAYIQGRCQLGRRGAQMKNH